MSKEINKYVLTLDLGKDSVKAMGVNKEEADDLENIKKYIFKTKIYDLTKGYIEMQGNTFKTEFNGKKLLVGEQGTERSLKTSKTDELHQVCAYVAITKFLKPGTKNNEIDIILACPVTVLTNADDKEEYKKLIKGDGPIKIKVNDQDYEFTITDITLKAEGSGILYLMPELFKNKKVAVSDFGGLNMTVTIFKNGICVDPENDRFAEEFGARQLINRLSKSFTSYRNGNIVDYSTSEEALERGYLLNNGKKDTKSILAMNNCKNIFFEDACAKLATHSVNLQDLDQIIFIGGTSDFLTDQIATIENSFKTDDPQWSSVEGLFKIALKKYAR